MGPLIVLYGEQLWITKIIVSSVKIRIDMQYLSIKKIFKDHLRIVYIKVILMTPTKKYHE